MGFIRFFLIFISFLFTSHATIAFESNQVSTPHVQAKLVTPVTSVAPGQEIPVALYFEIIPGWHTYWENAGDSGTATQIDWKLPSGVEIIRQNWQMPTVIDEGPYTVFGYYDKVYHFATFQVPENYAADTLKISAEANWLVCEEICIPESGAFEFTLPVGESRIQSLPGFAEAAARMVRDDSEEADFYLKDDQVVVALGQSTHPQQLSDYPHYYFPATESVVQYNQPQKIVEAENSIYIIQPASDFFDPDIETLDFVIKSDGAFKKLSAAKQSGTVPAAVTSALSAESSSKAQNGKIDIGFLQALVFAFIGGLILNLMPCVFPILSIKILSYVKKAGKEKKLIREEGLVFAAGVLVSFVLIAALLLALREAGQAIGWGFQLQSPIFVLVLTYLLFFLGLSLSGLVTFGTQLMGVGSSLTQKEGKTGAFFTGVLATIVATPCTAPFMGVAMGYAVTQPPAMAMSVFLLLGAGMATPYMLLTLYPKLLTYLPKPGAWMETFKEFMAFPVYLTAAWLLWVLSRQVDSVSFAFALGGGVLIAFAAWLWGKTTGRGWLAKSFVILSCLGVIYVVATITPQDRTLPSVNKSDVSVSSIPYSAERLEELRAQNKPVFVNMTAAWCITCLANERVALSTDSVQSVMQERGITYMKGDWTNYDENITRYLERYGRSGVPLYVYYPEAGEAMVLPQLLTPSIVLNALEK